MDLRILFGWVVIILLASNVYVGYKNFEQLNRINQFFDTPEVDSLRDLMSLYSSWR